MPSVLVVGAGYAGVHAAAAARSHGAEVTLVDPDGRHGLLPRLSAVAAGRRGAGDAWAPLDDLGVGAWERGRAVEVDVDAGTVRLDDGRVLAAGAVVVTVGASARLPDVPGLDRHAARTLRTAGDALLLRDELAGADDVVVVGGGATGVQLAAEVAARHPDTTVTLVESGDRLLPGLRRALGRRATALLRRRGVDVRLGDAVTAAGPDRVELGDGAVDGLVVWTTGAVADGAALVPGAATHRGRLVVDRQLRLGGRALAAGDVALHRDLLGGVLAPSAQVALEAGRAAGANAARIATGRPPRAAHLVDLGWIVDLGGGRGVASVGPLPLAAPLLDRLPPLLHEAVDARHLLQAGGPRALLRHATGRHDPDPTAVRRAERGHMRSVG